MLVCPPVPFRSASLLMISIFLFSISRYTCMQPTEYCVMFGWGDWILTQSVLIVVYFSVYEPKRSVRLYALIIFRFNDGN
jgi:hypothetical protein